MTCIFILYNKRSHNWTLFFGRNTICNLLQFFWEPFANIVRKCGSYIFEDKCFNKTEHLLILSRQYKMC